MELLITSQDLEPLPDPKVSFHNKPLGLLNSNYQTIAKDNFNNLKTPSLFNIKQRIKSRNYNTCCNVETILKVSIFLFFLIIALN